MLFSSKSFVFAILQFYGEKKIAPENGGGLILLHPASLPVSTAQILKLHAPLLSK